MVTVWAALLHLLLASAAVAADFSSPIVSVLDSDTLEGLHNEHPERIRLNDIDCQEKGQVYGNNAKHAASELVFGKEITLQTFGKDKSWRTIGEVTLPDGTNVNHMMLVKDGCCWWYRKYAPRNMVFEKIETEA